VVERAQVVEVLDTRARQLEEDNVKLSDLNRMKDVFLSTASHELKTPLSSVIAYAELLDDNEGRLTKEQSREFIGRLRGEAMRLLGLIEDILDLSRLESGKLHLKPRDVHLEEVARGALATSQMLAQRHGVELVADFAEGLPPLHLDEVKVRQVVVNLLVNAVKFSPQGGKVTLATFRENNFARLEVTDHGIGVSPDQATHIFELFGQGPGSEANARGGLGIGLHLVKRLSEMHGGQVGVNSKPGSGSTFWVRLPLPATWLHAEQSSEVRAA
jgi:signal transduction histidine kinase